MEWKTVSVLSDYAIADLPSATSAHLKRKHWLICSLPFPGLAHIMNLRLAHSFAREAHPQTSRALRQVAIHA
jgi:hypothetical protein